MAALHGRISRLARAAQHSGSKSDIVQCWRRRRWTGSPARAAAAARTRPPGAAAPSQSTSAPPRRRRSPSGGLRFAALVLLPVLLLPVGPNLANCSQAHCVPDDRAYRARHSTCMPLFDAVLLMTASTKTLRSWRGCCRRDRNRQTALATYYRRKARIAELRSTLANLTSEHAALETLADMAEASGDCAGAPFVLCCTARS